MGSRVPPADRAASKFREAILESHSLEDFELFDFAEALQDEQPPAEPWFMESTRLRRIHFLHLNRELAGWKKRVQEDRKVSVEDIEAIGKVLREQATAIRDFQLIRSLDFLSPSQKAKRMSSSIAAFPSLLSPYPGILPFQTENYRCLPHPNPSQPTDQLREFLRTYAPRSLTWTKEEKLLRKDLYDRKFAPQNLSPSADRLARFLIAMTGALFVLVPMYIMSLNQNRTKNLVTTTVAVVLFAVVCSITLRTTIDQTLGSTAAYSAVLVVFVGLTS